MSDLFFLDVPRTRVSRGVMSDSHSSSGSRFSLPDPLPPAGSFASVGSSGGGGWRLWPWTVCVVSAGAALSFALRVWMRRRRFSSPPASGGKFRGRRARQKGPVCPAPRVVFHAGMEGIPAAKEERVAMAPNDVEASPVEGSPRISDGGSADEISNGDENGDTRGKERGHDAGGILQDGGPENTKALRSSSLEFVTSDGERYKRVSRLGRGSFGSVFKCINLVTGQLVAVKEVRLGDDYNTADVDDLRSEFELLSRIHHPNVIRIIGYHVGQRHARLFLEWAAGGSLSDIMKGVSASCATSSPSPSPPSSSAAATTVAAGLHEDLVRSYVQQILSALQCLHEHGIIHRDLKPQNILADHMGVLRVTDFGLSRLVADGASAVQTVIAGTPRYMAPETIQAGRFSCGSDLWALGATMSELLTGKVPWSHLQPPHLQQLPSLLYHICSDPEGHPVIPANISDEAKDFMTQCFRRDPRDRGTAASLLQHPFLKRRKDDQNKE